MKPGYKQTEAGVIPTELVSLGSVTKWLSGGTPSRSVDEFWRGDIPWISASTLRTVEISDSKQHVTIDAIASGSKMAPVGATLLLVRGSALHNEILAGLVVKPVCFNQDVKALVPSQSVVPKFLTYSLLGRESELLKLVSSAGNTAGVLDTKIVKQFIIWIPGLREQRAIAEALSDMDALLEGLERLIAKKLDLKQAAMQQLLTGQTRLPGFHGEWEVRLVKEFGEVVTGGTPSTKNSEFWGEGYPWITPTDISTEHDIFTSERTITREGLEAIRKLPANTVLVTCIASIGKNAILRSAGGCNQQINAIIPNNDNCAEFIYFLMEANKQYLFSNAGTTATAILSKLAFSEMEFFVPEKREQTAIATVLSDMDNEIAALEARRDKTRQLKQAMMQELLTGKTRLV